MPSYIEDSIKKHEKFDIRKIDLLKINSIEIMMSLIQFTPSASVRHFIVSSEQKRAGSPFIKQLVNHMLYSYEQGIKVQVMEFFKALLDIEANEKKIEFLDLFY